MYETLSMFGNDCIYCQNRKLNIVIYKPEITICISSKGIIRSQKYYINDIILTNKF